MPMHKKTTQKKHRNKMANKKLPEISGSHSHVKIVELIILVKFLVKSIAELKQN
jgi:hypothetical protein